MMEPPRWLMVLAGLAVINFGLVAVSLLQRHSWTVPTTDQRLVDSPAFPFEGATTEASGNIESNSTNARDKELIDAQQRLNLLPIPQVTPSSQPVSADDPLMKEIRQQAAEQLGDLLIKPEEK